MPPFTGWGVYPTYTFLPEKQVATNLHQLFPLKLTAAGWRKKTYTPWKFNSSPLKISHPKRKVIFQPSFFRDYVKLRGCMFSRYLNSYSYQRFPQSNTSISFMSQLLHLRIGNQILRGVCVIPVWPSLHYIAYQSFRRKKRRYSPNKRFFLNSSFLNGINSTKFTRFLTPQQEKHINKTSQKSLPSKCNANIEFLAFQHHPPPHTYHRHHHHRLVRLVRTRNQGKKFLWII